jgi:hypothetical protein
VTRVTETLSKPAPPSSKPRVAALVGLTLLEVLRSQDRPSEVLQDEDPSLTMPRRLGLSDVVERQIRRYRDEVRRRGRISDEEVKDLVRLVIRRPDSEEVFFRTGQALAQGSAVRSRWRSALPGAMSYALARRAVRRRLQRLFGRRVGGFAPGPFTMEGRALVFIQSDPGGDACQIVSGLCQAVLERHVSSEARVVHSLCESRRDPVCRWTVLAEEKAWEPEGVPDLMLNPEPG